jgi:hypothetical protein
MRLGMSFREALSGSFWWLDTPTVECAIAVSFEAHARDLGESLALLPASLYDDRGEEVARATMRFDVRADWWKCMRSFRLRLALASHA